MQAAGKLEAEGVVGRGHRPALACTRYDWDAIKQSVKKTNRVLFVNEDTEVTNFGEHLLRRTVEELFYELYAPPKLLAGAHVPGIGLADNLEHASVPQLEQIVASLRELVSHKP